jgi:hypothetical protein
MAEWQKNLNDEKIECRQHRWRVISRIPFKAKCMTCNFVTFIRKDVMTRREYEVLIGRGK